MKTITKISTLLICFILYSGCLSAQSFEMREVICDMSQPWEITYGPDGYLWVTESQNYRVSRVHPGNGTQEYLIDLSNRKNFANYSTPWPQGGLTGLALHPELLSGKPYVYLAYVFRFDSCQGGNSGCFFKTRLSRFTYDSITHGLGNEIVICDTIPGSTDHNGGRIAIGPRDGNNYLFYSVGDMGAGHAANGDREHHGQEKNKYEGKILRFNLTPDQDVVTSDSWIPNDNPFTTDEKQSAVWSLGHRNPQGLVFGTNGILYEAEHGPYSDDEINIILPAKNYGFPIVSGFADGNYNGAAVGAGSGVPLINSEQNNALGLGAAYKDPIMSFFPAPNAAVQTIFTNDDNNTPPYPNYYLSWPTIAPAGMDFYDGDAIPGWKNSLLVTSLKLAKVFRLKLSGDGQSVVGDPVSYFDGLGRFRDIAISPDGSKIYIACDSMGQIAGPTAGTALPAPNKGCILEFNVTTVGVTDPFEASVQFYPNPATERLYMDLGLLAEETVRVTAFNYLGSQVLNREMDKPGVAPLPLDVSDWPAGAYMVSIQREGDVPRITKKVIISRTK